MKYIGTILLGLVLIAVITPLSQFLTLHTVNLDLETATPIPLALGLVVSLVLVLLPLKLLAKRRWLSRPHLVVLYTMLTVAVPVMNLGMVRPVFLGMFAITAEYLGEANKTYRIAFAAADPDWIPIVPTTEGLAYVQADRVLDLLDDPRARADSKKAQQAILRAIGAEVERGLEAATQPTTQAATQPDTAATAPVEAAAATRPAGAEPALLEAVGRLGVDDAITITEDLKRDAEARAAAEALGLVEPLQARREAAVAESDRMAAALPPQLADLEELAVNLLADEPDFVTSGSDGRFAAKPREWLRLDAAWWAEADPAFRQRVAEQRAWLTETVDGQPRWQTFRDRVVKLRADKPQALAALAAERRKRLEALSDEAVNRQRRSLTYRLSKAEAKDLVRLGSEQGEPALNVEDFRSKFDPGGFTAREELGITVRLKRSHEAIPWHLWITPMVMWGLLFLAIFLAFMCLAELLRRKWIEKENLAFPLVEVADHVLRHDASLETAEDPLNPPRRDSLVNPLLVVGTVLAFAYISLDALSHYGFVANADPTQATTFNVSGEVLTTDWLREMSKVFFVLSPVVLGIAFLISLQMSFSIWVLFFAWTVVAALIQTSTQQKIQDSLFTGWAGGKLWPFAMEQLVGAVVCYAAILMLKFFRTPQVEAAEVAEPKAGFVPGWLMKGGLVLLPVAILALLWDYGLTSPVLLVLVFVLATAQAIAGARVRAETGLPTHHVSYEFTKLPVVLGITGLLGASVFGVYALIAWLPLTLVFRMLPQHLENIELARRHKLSYRVIGVAAVLGFVAATVVGMGFFIHLSHLWGGPFWGADSPQSPKTQQIMQYALWNTHFRGAEVLGDPQPVHWVRVWAMVAGAAIFGGLALLRGKLLRFPLHPVGYLVVLMSIYYEWVSPYSPPDYPGRPSEASMLWGSVLAAWLIKTLLIKYGGMNMYKRAKPLFIGLVVGSVLAIFAWDMLDLGISLFEADLDLEKYEFLKNFVNDEVNPYSPAFF